MKTQSMSIKDFMNYEKETFLTKVERHFNKYGRVYQVAGLTAVVLIAPHGAVFASSFIDSGANRLYKELIGIGKWLIIFKGGFDVLKQCGNGDFESAKKGFFGYVLTYLFLLGLPFIMDEVDKVFNGVTTTSK
jgi:hypothetical protein